MASKTYVLVINLRSRKAKQALREIKDVFKTKSCKLEVLSASNPENIPKLLDKVMAKKPAVLVLGGGDGTLISGIEYLSKKDYKRPIGLLPLGTANYLARNLSIPLTIEGSIEILLKNNSREIPIGEANDKYFALSFVLGVTKEVSENVSNELKRKFGQIAYLLEGLKQLRNHDAFEYTVTSPSLKRPLKGKSHQIVVYNSDLNLQVKLLPDHNINKPTLKVVISKSGNNIFKLIWAIVVHVVTFGKVRPYMRVFETTNVRIETKPAIKADYDGEVASKSPFNVSMCKKKVKIIC